MTLPQLLLIVVIAWLIYASRNRFPHLRQLTDELRQRMPVFSAETTSGKEAEFIRDRLPKRPSWVLYGLAATLMVVVGVLFWWLG
jgi:hypothetical protein